MKPIDYHSDPKLHGSYQYVSLKKIVDDFVFESIDDDSILKNTRRARIVKLAKDGIRELNKNVFNEIKAIEMTVPEHLSIVLPHDFVSAVRISVVVEDKVTQSLRLQPLNTNNNINIAKGYLQDHNAEILFDQDGFILEADASNSYNIPFKKYEFTCGGDSTKISKYGEYTIDKSRGTILFSSDLFDKEIVVEYLTDGLQFDIYGEEEIKVHKNMIQVLKDWVYFTLIQYKKNIAQNEKYRALNRFKTTRHQAKLAKIKLIEIGRKVRTSKNI